MNTKRWIALAIVAVVVVGSLGLIKLFPFWATLACLVSVIAGFAAGYLFKKDSGGEVTLNIESSSKSKKKVKKSKSTK